MPSLTVAELSRMDRENFVAALEGVVEHSPWVLERAWQHRPFADRAALASAIEEAIGHAGLDAQLRLIRCHPELAGKAAVRGEMTHESKSEQDGAGLTACSPVEFARLQELNSAYRARFGHPFILAVRGRTRSDIIDIFAHRLQNTPGAELAESLRQIARIAALRLEERVSD